MSRFDLIQRSEAVLKSKWALYSLPKRSGCYKTSTRSSQEAIHLHAAPRTAEYEKYDKELKPTKDLGDAFSNELDEVDMEVRNLIEVRHMHCLNVCICMACSLVVCMTFRGPE